MSIIPIDKWRRMMRMIRQNGGLFKASYKMWRFDTLKDGKYVGCDANGNKYYMNDNYMIGRSRWVEHHIKYRWDYDATHKFYMNLIQISSGLDPLRLDFDFTKLGLGTSKQTELKTVTSEWFGWLHYKTDKLPSEDSAKHNLLCSREVQRWLLPFEENMTATNEAYYPYSTTRPSINIWDGRTVCNRND